MSIITQGLLSPRLITQGFGGAPKPLYDLKLAIVQAIADDPDTQSFFGDNVYPVVIPQTATYGIPTLCYLFDDSDHDVTLVAPAGMRYVRLILRASSVVHGDNERARDLLRSLIQGFVGNLEGVPIISVWFEGEFDEYDEPIGGSDLGLHSKELTWTVKLRESIPVRQWANPSAKWMRRGNR